LAKLQPENALCRLPDFARWYFLPPETRRNAFSWFGNWFKSVEQQKGHTREQWRKRKGYPHARALEAHREF
jgi:hypothetical protein